MTLPHYTWLLIFATVGEFTYFATLGVLWLRKQDPASIPLFALASLWGGGICGVLYGLAQRDYLFVVGQACVLFVAIRIQSWKEK